MDYLRRRRRFEETLRDVLAKLERDHVTRIDRSEVEEMGQRFEIDQDEARKLFVDARGDIWQGEFVESDEEPGWEAVELERAPPPGAPPTTAASRPRHPPNGSSGSPVKWGAPTSRGRFEAKQNR